MPQIQVLPPAPGFGSQLGQALGGGLSQGISASLNQMLEQKQINAKNQALMEALGLGRPQQMKQTGEIENAGKQIQGGKLPQLTQEQLLAASIQNPALAPALGAIYKNQQKEAKEAQDKELGQSSLDRMAEILGEGKIGLGSQITGKFPGKAAEAVGEFESLTGALEAMLVDRVSRGTLSNSRFKYITETLLPKPGDPESKIRGKIKALSRELDLKLPDLRRKKSQGISSGILMRDPAGNLRRIPREQAIEAQKEGYKLEQ